MQNTPFQRQWPQNLTGMPAKYLVSFVSLFLWVMATASYCLQAYLGLDEQLHKIPDRKLNLISQPPSKELGTIAAPRRPTLFQIIYQQLLMSSNRLSIVTGTFL